MERGSRRRYAGFGFQRAPFATRCRRPEACLSGQCRRHYLAGARRRAQFSQPTYLLLSTTVSPEAAPGAGNGAINLTPNGGTPPYSYRWSTGATTQDLYSLIGGVYTVTVTDDNGCAKTASATVASDGCEALISAFPYVESFENGPGQWKQSTNDAFNWTRGTGPTPTKRTGPSQAADGQYYFYIESSEQTGGSAILKSPCLDISNLMDPSLTFSYNMYGSNMGTLSVQASADNGSNWTTLWMRFGNQGESWYPAMVSLSGYSSHYTMVRFVGTATGGQRGDMAIDAITIDGDPMPCNAPQLAVSSTPAHCYGGSDGTATVNASLGVGPYAYAWPNGAATRTVAGLPAGSYEVTVTGTNGCSARATAIVAQPGEMALSFAVTDESAPNANDGAINLTVSGGSPGYAYSWSNGAGSQDLSGLSEGMYAVTVTDANGCTKTGNATITMPSACEPMATLPYRESFENGFGLWGQSASDDFDWSRNSGGTNSNNTGPSGASDGIYYAYTESTSNNNRSAFLEGPCFNLSSAALPTLVFDYHMYGNQMGTLTLQASMDEGNRWATIWSRSGSQNRTWQNAYISLQSYANQTIRLRFTGTIGGVRSDMAIDNIGLFDAAGLPPAQIAAAPAEMKVSLRPNPANDRLTTSIESSLEQDAELFLTGQLGHVRPLGAVNLRVGRNEVLLPVAELNPGVYFLSVQTRTNRIVERLLIQR
ncbi:MAG: hypothetical protein H6557_16110 [Lewinellaceae bacterium]|nr:hypothetical protein [Phaeodactylibacter sp.]MCB9038141.1 hypothetical protein [Lewinellaceae bacterium]